MSMKDTLTCQIPGCDKPYSARGLCATHYRAWWWRNLTPEQRAVRRKRMSAQARARWAALPEEERRARSAYYYALAKERHPAPNGTGPRRSVKQWLILDLVDDRPGQWTTIISLWDRVMVTHEHARLEAVRRMVHRMVADGVLVKRRARGRDLPANMIEVRPA